MITILQRLRESANNLRYQNMECYIMECYKKLAQIESLVPALNGSFGNH